MDAELERRTLAAEDGHWWYRGRRGIVLDAARRSLGPAGGSAADPRCRLRWRRRARRAGARSEPRSGSSPRREPRARARARGGGGRRRQTSRRSRSPTASSTSPSASDVLEHLDDDRGALAELRRVVACRRRPGGHGAGAPPALEPPRRGEPPPAPLHAPDAAGRRGGRRVARSAPDPLQLAAAAGRGGPAPFRPGRRARDPPAAVNRALELPLDLERRAIAAGVAFPFGLSLLAELG